MAEVPEQPTANAEPVEMLLNMGPQHPFNPWRVSLVLWVDGEKIVECQPHIGYLHGVRKSCARVNSITK